MLFWFGFIGGVSWLASAVLLGKFCGGANEQHEREAQQ